MTTDDDLPDRMPTAIEGAIIRARLGPDGPLRLSRAGGARAAELLRELADLLGRVAYEPDREPARRLCREALGALYVAELSSASIPLGADEALLLGGLQTTVYDLRALLAL